MGVRLSKCVGLCEVRSERWGLGKSVEMGDSSWMAGNIRGVWWLEVRDLGWVFGFVYTGRATQLLTMDRNSSPTRSSPSPSGSSTPWRASSSLSQKTSEKTASSSTLPNMILVSSLVIGGPSGDAGDDSGVSGVGKGVGWPSARGIWMSRMSARSEA